MERENQALAPLGRAEKGEHWLWGMVAAVRGYGGPGAPESVTVMEDHLLLMVALADGGAAPVQVAPPGTWKDARVNHGKFQARWGGQGVDLRPLLRAMAGMEEREAPVERDRYRFTAAAFGERLRRVWPGEVCEFRLVDVADLRLNQVLIRLKDGQGRPGLVLVQGVGEEGAEGPRSTHFRLSLLSSEQRAHGGAALLDEVLRVVRRIDPPEVVVLRREEAAVALPAPKELKVLKRPEAAAPKVSFNLYLHSPCFQACAFCSVFELDEPVVVADGFYHQQVLGQLTAAREKGARDLRVHGFDPVTYGRFGEVLRAARESGFEGLELFSPFSNVVTEEVWEELARWGERLTLFVPVYGVRAALHDELVGREGAFTVVLGFLEQAAARLGRARALVQTVVMRQNLRELAALRDWCEARGAVLQLHLAFPIVPGRDPAYPKVAAPLEEVSTAIAEIGLLDRCADLPPCFRLRAGRAQAVKAARLGVGEKLLSGNRYRAKEFITTAFGQSNTAQLADRVAMVSCPVAGDCVLAGHCPREVYAQYAEVFGLGEFRAVMEEEITGLA